MSEDKKLLLLAIQQTLDDNTELLKKINNTPVNNNDVENVELNLKPINELLTNQLNNMVSLFESHLSKFNEISNINKTETSTISNKNFSLIGVSTNSKISPKKLFLIIFTLFFIFCTTWVGLHYWYSQGYKIKDQFSAYKTIQTIKYESKKSYTKDDILNLYQKFQLEDTIKNNFFNQIELKIIQNKEIEKKEKELNSLKNKK